MGKCLSKQGEGKAKDEQAPYEKSPVKEGETEANGVQVEAPAITSSTEKVAPEDVTLEEPAADESEPVADGDVGESEEPASALIPDGTERTVTKRTVTRTTVVKSSDDVVRSEESCTVSELRKEEDGEVAGQTVTTVTKEVRGSGDGDAEVTTETVVTDAPPEDVAVDIDATLQERMEASMSRLISQLPPGCTVSPESIQEALASSQVSGVKTTQVTRVTTTASGEEVAESRDVTRTVEHYEGPASEPVVTSSVTEHLTGEDAKGGSLLGPE